MPALQNPNRWFTWPMGDKEKHIVAYRDWLILNGRKKSTAIQSANHLKLLFKNNVVVCSRPKVDSFLSSCVQKGYSSSHINYFVNTVRTFNQYLKSKELNYDPNCLTVSFVADKYKERATMTEDEIKAFLAAPCPTTTYKHARSNTITTRPVNPSKHLYWTVFFSIMATSGMRTGEVSKLTTDDVDFARNVFILRDTKTNDNRIVPISESVQKLIYDWCNKIGDGYLFPSKRPEGHTSNVEWNYNFHRRCKDIGIKRANLTPYSLRHSFITRLLETDGVNIFDVKNIAGHHNTKTTEHYYHLTTKRLQKVIQKDPLSRKDNPQMVLQIIEDYINSLDLENDNRFKFKKVRDTNYLNFSIAIVNDIK